MAVHPILVVTATAMGLLWPVTAGAQQPRDLSIRVRVVDSTNAPVRAADISIVRGLRDILGSGATDDAGVRSLTVPRREGDYQVVVRRIGYQRAERFFAAPAGDSTSVRIVLRRSVQTLETVNVTATEDVKRKSYHADADDIANSGRPILDAMDVLIKLRPDMLYGRSGHNTGCGVTNVWVNGVRIPFAPVNPMAMARIPSVAPPQRSFGRGGGRRAPLPSILEVPRLVWNVLSTIKPEHIAEVNYADCFDTSVNAIGGNRAVYIILKPGISFEPGRGSYVDDGPAHVSDRAAAVDTLPDYRRRLLGVFDDSTGSAIDGVEVIDVLTGTKSVTTLTGTVSLWFLPDGNSTLRLVKAGFATQTVDVSISPRDTLPITLVLSRPK